MGRHRAPAGGGQVLDLGLFILLIGVLASLAVLLLSTEPQK